MALKCDRWTHTRNTGPHHDARTGVREWTQVAVGTTTGRSSVKVVHCTASPEPGVRCDEPSFGPRWVINTLEPVHWSGNTRSQRSKHLLLLSSFNKPPNTLDSFNWVPLLRGWCRGPYFRHDSLYSRGTVMTTTHDGWECLPLCFGHVKTEIRRTMGFYRRRTSTRL